MADFKVPSRKHMELLRDMPEEVEKMEKEFEDSTIDKAEMGDWCIRHVPRLFEMLKELLEG